MRRFRTRSRIGTSVVTTVALALLLTACYRPLAENHQKAHPGHAALVVPLDGR